MGRPFADASERLVEEALAEARIDRADVYVTLAVKHIRRTAQGRRPPGPSHIRACWPWLRAEINLVRPRALVCLGERVAEAIIGPGFRLSRHRGELVDTPLRPHVAATTDPREIAELADPARRAEMGAFVRDLRAIGRTLRSTG